MKEFLIDLVRSADEIFDARYKILKNKSPNDVLSEADLKLNEYFVNGIKKKYPTAKIIAEESENEELSNDLTFVLDPLDGTCNFSFDIPLCGIQLAVLENKKPILSIIYLPNQDELYVAEKNKGVLLNGKRLKVNKDIKHNDGVLILSDFYKDEKDISLDSQYKLVESLRLDFLKTRLFGAACNDFAYLATSKAQAYICYYRNLWDIIPGLFMMEELGMVYKRINGEIYHFGDESLVVANNQETLDLIINKAKLL